ncbi:MAG: undecaprenyl-diphosphate phosphatase [Bacteroidales bacterium]|jgi:undecaprenyl-diphosphatase|nr:undecaprenyl-diphosphate phosphatase [Bacteroidales bacterium]MDD2263583.1 undecaprenyl-diphosphate phosphatase [Bacteroidales bacterium]MDD2830626.1 undecaprenyl-diphosphate phosphatase [Bacteroidales bacterium]MDD3208895.1 undecaprenyl-diphosphate phosphatase [Bacteroidales bacterium]MDD3697380.1 undecaprenyl-diphosphate phosphatase [Bacteroidales bacterium]
MNGLEALLLGLLQGLTEFIPVSSSGHLVIVKNLFGIETKDASFEIIVHAATVLSTVVVFRKELWEMISDTVRFRRTGATSLTLRILFSTIPVLIVGLFFKDRIASLFTGGLTIVGWMLLLTAALLGTSQWLSVRKQKKGNTHPIGYRDAILIGIAQAVAVMPGLSRSGATIATGLSLGNHKDQVAPFSFMMVLIPVLGETFLEIIGGGFTPAATGISFSVMAIGFAAAFISGLFACKFMIAIVRKVRFTWFAIYCLLAGLACLIVPLL